MEDWIGNDDFINVRNRMVLVIGRQTNFMKNIEYIN